ncbi:unnamed protein product, partial [Discosporangium mesarthrocarpum]
TPEGSRVRGTAPVTAGVAGKSVASPRGGQHQHQQHSGSIPALLSMFPFPLLPRSGPAPGAAGPRVGAGARAEARRGARAGVGSGTLGSPGAGAGAEARVEASPPPNNQPGDGGRGHCGKQGGGVSYGLETLDSRLISSVCAPIFGNEGDGPPRGMEEEPLGSPG